ncbi:unnamed protein product [Prorocentrum cordatum]|uniref:Uncharacterized protein n=1 Tax=Prorocentrum cordatum TaxID=2364126 RepID=A0ABN9PGB0_9DINO|nr:unnamed protein product [Polarella glacialis]
MGGGGSSAGREEGPQQLALLLREWKAHPGLACGHGPRRWHRQPRGQRPTARAWPEDVRHQLGPAARPPPARPGPLRGAAAGPDYERVDACDGLGLASRPGSRLEYWSPKGNTPLPPPKAKEAARVPMPPALEERLPSRPD